MSFPCERVLCPTDLSPIGDRAVSAAYRLACRSGVVHLLYVHEPALLPSPLDGTVVQAYYPDAQELAAVDQHAREHLERLVPASAGEDGIRTEIHATHDSSVRAAILWQARESDADVIVMGTRGRSTIGRLLLGSVAMEVLRASRIPVILVHEPAA